MIAATTRLAPTTNVTTADRRQDRPVKVNSNAAAKNSQGTPTQIAQYSVRLGQVSAPKVPNGPEIAITAVVNP